MTQTDARTRSAERSATARSVAIVGLIALVDFLVHLNASGHYGYFRDELYSLICARHLAFGYIAGPPLVVLAAKAGVAFFGSSLRAIRLLPALAAAATVLLAGLIARELGGRRLAQVLAALSVLLAPAFLGAGAVLTRGSFAPLFWTACAWVLARMIRTGNTRLWLVYGLLLGIGLENRYSILFLAFATVIALLLVPERRLLASRWFWLGGLLAMLIFLPNLLWQAAHGFPALGLLHHAGGVSSSFLGFLGRQVFLLNPLALPLWLGGLLWCFTREGKRFRALGWIYLVVLACLLAVRADADRLFPAYPMLLAVGGVALERWFELAAQHWLRPAYIVALVLAGFVLAPIRLPVLPLKTYIRYSRALHLTPRPEASGQSILPPIYAGMIGWQSMVAAVARIYFGLPPGARSHTVILCANPAQASAIDFFGSRYGLPHALCPHGDFYMWGPGEATMLSVLAVGVSRKDLEKTFSWVEPVRVLDNVYAMGEENGPVFYCRGPNVPFRDSWEKLKKWD